MEMLRKRKDNTDQDPASGHPPRKKNKPEQCFFCHDSLKNASKEIRLFRVHRSDTFASRPRLILRTFKLDSSPRYTAISYLWGSSTRSENIEVDDKRFATTANAHYALRQVIYQYSREMLHTKYFWMDSICIDQSDLDEKGKQVSLMGDIFRNAIEVLACIGPHAAKSQLVVDVFKATDISRMIVPSAYAWRQFSEEDHEVWDRLTSVLTERWQGSWLSGVTFNEFRNDFSIAAASFCNRRYWRRIWMIQEIRLAEIVKILCGSALLDLSCIAPFFSYAVNIERQNRLPGCSDSPMCTLLSNSHHTQDHNRREGPWLDAKDAFLQFSECECSDFRDRVYALLKLLKFESRSRESFATRIRPDYRVTKVGLLAQVAEDACRVKGATEPFTTIENLYRALDLSTDDSGIRKLLEQRKQSAQDNTTAKYEAVELRTETRQVEWMSMYSFILDDAPGGLSLQGGAKPIAHEDTFATDTIILDGRTTRLYIDEETVGWVSTDVRAGDVLLAVPQLIVRRDETHGSEGFRIIGHAALRNRLWGKRQLEPITVKFGIEDFIAFVALRVDIGWEDLSRSNVEALLSISPKRFAFSSWAEIEKDPKKKAALSEWERAFEEDDSRLGREVDGFYGSEYDDQDVKGFYISEVDQEAEDVWQCEFTHLEEMTERSDISEDPDEFLGFDYDARYGEIWLRENYQYPQEMDDYRCEQEAIEVFGEEYREYLREIGRA